MYTIVIYKKGVRAISCQFSSHILPGPEADLVKMKRLNFRLTTALRQMPKNSQISE